MIGTVLPLALVVGLSPVGILPAVLLLLTPRARVNGPAYLAAWLAGLTALTAVSAWLAHLADPGAPTDEGIGWIQVVTGAIFLVMAAVKWLRRPAPGQVKATPKWMAALDSYSPAQSARLGALLACANPKNLAMAVAAGAEIAVLSDGTAATVWGIVAFVLIGSLGVGAPVLLHAVLGDRTAPTLDRSRVWLQRNATVLSAGVLAILGVLLLLGGLPSAL
jgi:hypothetical protein